jgi:mRNA-degrading endonuclease RelE of RelBE toxin-antitoxin system
MAYNFTYMDIETKCHHRDFNFARQVLALIDDDSYRRLQTVLVLRPDVGDVIPGSGGLRKIRWGAKGRGKRGGVRVIYYLAVKQDRIMMYAKSEQDDLTAEQLKVLRRIIEEEYPRKINCFLNW